MPSGRLLFLADTATRLDLSNRRLAIMHLPREEELQESQLRTLKLDRNRFTNGRTLERLCTMRYLRCLLLSYNRIFSCQIFASGGQTKMSNLRVLDLSFNRLLIDSDLTQLFEALPALRVLRADCSLVTVENGLRMANYLRTARGKLISSLSLRYNTLLDHVAMAFAASIEQVHDSRLRSLHLEQNAMSGEAWKRLYKALVWSGRRFRSFGTDYYPRDLQTIKYCRRIRQHINSSNFQNCISL